MAGHYIRKRLRSAFLARRLAVFAGLLLVLSGIVFRFGGIPFDAFVILLSLVSALVTLALLMALIALARIWHAGHRGGGAALAAVFVAILVALPFAGLGALALRSPLGNSAATEGMLAQDALVSEPEPETADGATLGGRSFEARAPQVYAAARTVLGDLGWQVGDVVAGDPEGADRPAAAPSGPPRIPIPTSREDAAAEAEADPLDRPESDQYAIAALAKGPLLALPSDVSIRIVEDEGETYVDLRSVSRVGRFDLGQNRRFIEAFLARLDAAMLGAAAPKSE